MSEKLTIAVVTAFPPGQQSLNEYGFHFVRELIKRDDVAQVVVIADRLPTPMDELDMGSKLSVQRVWDFNSLRSLPRILRTLRRARPDGVIYNLQTASFGDKEAPAGLGMLTPMLSRLMGIPSGIIAHNIIAGIDLEQTILKGQKLRQWIVRTGGAVISRAMASASYMTVTLESYADHLIPRYPRADITHVHHGTFETDVQDFTPLPKRPRRIVTMGKFGTYKRLETLIAAFEIVRTQDPQIELVIGGTDHPNTPGYVDGLAQRHERTKGLKFHGYVAEEDVPDFFGTAMISVFDYESTTGSSGVLHQTAAYGAVPVFPRIGDFVDVVEGEGISGHYYAPGDAQGMADAIMAILDDLPAAKKMAESNHKAAQDMPLSEVAGFHVDKLRGLKRF